MRPWRTREWSLLLVIVLAPACVDLSAPAELGVRVRNDASAGSPPDGGEPDAAAPADDGPTSDVQVRDDALAGADGSDGARASDGGPSVERDGAAETRPAPELDGPADATGPDAPRDLAWPSDPTPPPDAGAESGGPAPGELVIDDFEDAVQTSNRLGGAVTWENQNVALVGGQQRFVWNGAGTQQSFVEALRSDFCDRDLTAYTKLTFKIRASVANKRISVHLMVGGSGACRSEDLIRMTTVTIATTMTTHEVDMTRTVRNRGQAVVFLPLSTDGTEYFLDDVVLAP